MKFGFTADNGCPAKWSPSVAYGVDSQGLVKEDKWGVGW